MLLVVVLVGYPAETPARMLEAGKRPGLRAGIIPVTFVCKVIPMPFARPDRLGKHEYRSFFGICETTGMLYTKKGGYIDLAHARNSADWTACLAWRIENAVYTGAERVEFTVIGPSVFVVHIPPSMQGQDAEQVREFAIKAAQYASFTACIWHEVITWYGYSCIPFLTERPSAFSYEETYSDIFGTYVASLALRDEERAYNQAMTFHLQREIAALKPVNKKQARQLTRQMDGRWWNSWCFWPSNKILLKRNLDIGLGDRQISPWLIHDSDKPSVLTLPEFAIREQITVEIIPKLKHQWPADAFPPGTLRLDAQRDLPRLMQRLEEDVQAELGADACRP